MERTRCQFSRDELLSMSIEDAFKILLGFYDESCPSDLTRKVDEEISVPYARYIQKYPVSRRQNFENYDSENFHFGEIDYYKKSDQGSTSETTTRKPELFDASKKETNTPNQFSLLSEIYDSLDGDNWYNNFGWKNKSIPICEWHGIKCYSGCLNDEILRNVCPVTGFSMPMNNLRGDIESVSSFLEQFPFLMVLHLNSNSLFGNLPDFQFPSMYFLNISANEITGTIPNFGGMPNVGHLAVVSNKLKGTIPNFSEIPSIISLWIGESDALIGTLPDFSAIPNLQVLSICEAHVNETVPDFGNIPKVALIYLYNNQLSGTIPDFKYIPNLMEIWLSGNQQLSGTIPDFSGIPNLRGIELSGNQLSGTIPDFSHIPNIDGFNLSINFLSGTIPDFSNIPNIRVLWIAINPRISGTVPDFSGIPNIIEIEISGNMLDGTVPDFSKIPTAIKIRLSGNQLSGTIPNFNFIPIIVEIRMISNQLTGTITDFSKIQNIEWIYLSNNKLKGNIPDFSHTHNLEILDISRNSLDGTVPLFSRLHAIKTFSAYENKLIGSVPSFKNCLETREIILFRNNLNSFLPPFKLPKLSKLDISENQITGTIPSDWEIPSIQTIDLSRNRMNGKIPAVFEYLHQLKSLNLAHNRFSEKVPTMFWSLQNLVTIDLRNNSFFGDVGSFIVPGPLLFKFSLVYQNLIMDDNNLSGELNWKVYYNAPNIRTLSLKNNKIEKIGELLSLSTWTSLELSGNPIIGSVPESYGLFSKLEYLGLKNTSTSFGSAIFIPRFMKQTKSFSLETPFQKYICPSVYADLGSVYMKVEMDPTYHEYGLCKCLPGFFGFGNKCMKCPNECECGDGISLKNCHFTPNVTSIVGIVPCMNPDVCHFSIPDSAEKRMMIKNGKYKFPCEKGYTGRDCSFCEEGYLFDSGECKECSSDYSAFKIAAFIVVLFFGVIYQVGMAWIGESAGDEGDQDKDNENANGADEKQDSASLDIFLFYTQILQVLGNIVALPNLSVSGKFVGNVFSLKLPTLECVVGNHPHITSLLNLARIPCVFLIALLGLKRFITKKDKRNVDKVVAVMFIFLEGTYFSVVQDVVSTFGCTLHDKGLDSWFVNTYPWIQCSPFSDSYAKMIGAAIPGLIYMIFYPSFLWIIVMRGRKSRIQAARKKNANPESSHNSVNDSGARINCGKVDTGNEEIMELEMVELNSVAIVPKKSVQDPSIHVEEGHASDVLHNKNEDINQVKQERDEKKDDFTLNMDMDFDISIFEILCQSQVNRFSAIYEEEYDWWVVVRVFQSILFGFTAFVVPYTSPATLYFVFFILIQMSITLQNRYEPYLLDSDDDLSITCWLLLYISFFAALVQQLVPGNDWIAYAVIGLNAAFITVYIASLLKGAVQSLFGIIFAVAKKIGVSEGKIEECKEKASAYKEKVRNYIISLN